MTDTSQARQIEVTLKNGEIEMEDTTNGGQLVFQVKNESNEPHLFEVRGHGLVRTFNERLMPGEQKTMEVSLPPGSYTISCPEERPGEPDLLAHLEVRDPRRYPDED